MLEAVNATATVAAEISAVNDSGHCGSVDAFQDPAVINTTYYVGGVAMAVVALLGIAGNMLSIAVLSRPKMQDCFHRLLLCLSCYDTIYIICGGINYTSRNLKAGSNVVTILFPYLIHPFSYIGHAGVIFSTVAISLERFLGICYPLKWPPHNRRAYYYIVPVSLLSLAVNIPKFFETTTEYNQSLQKHEIVLNRDLRMNSAYIIYYKSVFRFVTMVLVPFLLLIVLNTRILWDLRYVRVQRFGTKEKVQKERNFVFILFSIVLTFFFCHVLSVVVDFFELIHVSQVMKCQELREQGVGHIFFPPEWVLITTPVSRFLMVTNSGVNFLLYCRVGSMFRRELWRMLRISSSSDTIRIRHFPCVESTGLQDSARGSLPRSQSRESSDTRKLSEF